MLVLAVADFFSLEDLGLLLLRSSVVVSLILLERSLKVRLDCCRWLVGILVVVKFLHMVVRRIVG